MKMLPIVEKHHLVNGLHYSFPLSIILAYNHLRPWVYENYIFIVAVEPKEFNPHPNYMEYYDGYCYADLGRERELLTQRGIPSDILEQCDIIDVIKKQIDKQCYPIIFLDEYYLPGAFSHNATHFLHETLICGYDEEYMYTLGFDSMNRYCTIKQSYKDIQQAYKEGLQSTEHGNISWARENRLIILGLPEIKTTYPYSPLRFAAKLERYLEGRLSQREIYLHQFDFWGKAYMGTAYYDYLKTLARSENYDVFRYYHHLYEHKCLLYDSMMYAQTQLPSGVLEDVIDRYQKHVVLSTGKMRLMSMKHSIDTTDTSEFREKAHDSLDALQADERDILQEAIAIIRTSNG